MRWFIGLNTAAFLLFIAHLVEERIRGALPVDTMWILAPTVIAFSIGLVFSYLRHAWAVGMTLGADLFLSVAIGYFHLNPASADFVGAIYSAFTNPNVGLLAAAIAVALWVVGTVAVVSGVWTLTRLEAHPFRGPAITS